jgi:ABC-2 type transport system permease protein
MVDNSSVNIKMGVDPRSDTANIVYRSILSIKMIHPQTGIESKELLEALRKGRITAVLHINKEQTTNGFPRYLIELTTASSSMDKIALLETVIRESVAQLNEKIFPDNKTAATVEVKKIPGTAYHQIDFILPGQIGFSILMACIFSSAFLFFNLRQGFVLKRFFATPILPVYLILGELFSRLFFQVIGIVIMVSLGYFAFHFTLINGLSTFFEMMVFSLFGMIVFMGIGFSISSILQNESSIAPVANTITLPQILLCGLFFPVENYPHWLQFFCKILPLTLLVDGLRKIAFEGTHIWQMPGELLGIFCWTVFISFITIRVFRWE